MTVTLTSIPALTIAIDRLESDARNVAAALAYHAVTDEYRAIAHRLATLLNDAINSIAYAKAGLAKPA